MLAGTKSGSGKTTVTCGILQGLINKGYAVSSFKCGPDYIDPMFHSKVIGIKSGNLDSFFTGENLLRDLLYRNSRDTDISVMEGVMGYYDGIGLSDTASSYSIAAMTKTPVILIVDAKGMSSSLGAVLKGFLSYKEESFLKGVIFNRISGSLYERVRKLAEDMGIHACGYVPDMPECSLKSRHLGLVTVDEREDIKRKLNILAGKLSDTVDFDAILTIAGEAPPLPVSPPPLPVKNREKVTVAVAQDEAFCFIYKDNLKLLEELGAELVPFSPLRDRELPGNADGLLLCGGYPELYAKDLSQNTSMLRAVKTAIERGMPAIAECGGFMYLHESLEDMEGREYPMAGVITGRCFKTGRLQRFGYLHLKGREDSLIAPGGQVIKAHEFHYWDSDNTGKAFHAVKAAGSGEWDCIHASENLYAGFPHLYFYGSPDIAKRFVNRCVRHGKSQEPCSLDRSAMAACKKHWDGIAKPIGSLGLFEDIIIKIAGIQGSEQVDLRKKAVVIMCGDNGVVKEKVTQTESSVTAVVTENFAGGTASINQMVMISDTKVIPVDIGIERDIHKEGVLDRKVGYGTGNIAKGPAMTMEQAQKAIKVGMDMIEDLKREGYNIIGTGEMGIGNTTTSSAVASVLLNLPVKEVTGRGAGLSEEGLKRKIRVIEEAIRINRPAPDNPVEVLARLGGYDLAGLTGLYLGGLKYGIPIVIDGVISSVAALIASRINKEAVNYMIPSHISKEPAGARIMEELGLSPVIHGNLALGEGTGTVLLFPLLDAVLKVYHYNSTFEDIRIQAYQRFETNEQ